MANPGVGQVDLAIDRRGQIEHGINGMDKEISADEFQAQGSRVREMLADVSSNPYMLEFSGRHQGLLRLKRWVAQHGALSLTLERAAELACLTPHHFSAAFHKHTGETFKSWRHRVRICWAVGAIETGQHSISEVVYLAGYRDRRAFERAIKQLTGATPGCILKSAIGTAARPYETESQVEPQSS